MALYAPKDMPFQHFAPCEGVQTTGNAAYVIPPLARILEF